jgi:hypothetical protein
MSNADVARRLLDRHRIRVLKALLRELLAATPGTGEGCPSEDLLKRIEKELERK